MNCNKSCKRLLPPPLLGVEVGAVVAVGAAVTVAIVGVGQTPPKQTGVGTVPVVGVAAVVGVGDASQAMGSQPLPSDAAIQTAPVPQSASVEQGLEQRPGPAWISAEQIGEPVPTHCPPPAVQNFPTPSSFPGSPESPQPVITCDAACC